MNESEDRMITNRVEYHNSIMRYVECYLQVRGYYTDLDHLFPNIINGRNGRIDVVGRKDNHRIAIEVESCRRQKTKVKLERCGFETNIVILLSEEMDRIEEQRQFYESSPKIKVYTLKEFEKVDLN